MPRVSIAPAPPGICDLAGEVFGRLLVIAYSRSIKSGGRNRSLWACRCECGNVCTRLAAYLRQYAGPRNYGCGECSKFFGIEKRRKTREIHGQCKAAEYRSWSAMLYRCFNSQCNEFDNYGGRGITVCDRWTDYRNFIADMGRKPSRLHSLDRIDNNGNYEPGNCRWADRKTQNNNKRKAKLCRGKPIKKVRFKGMEKTVAEWASHFGMSLNAIYYRLSVYSVEKALTMPSSRTRRQS
jgi:hypothetical protein